MGLVCGDFEKLSQIIFGIWEPASLPGRSMAVHFFYDNPSLKSSAFSNFGSEKNTLGVNIQT